MITKLEEAAKNHANIPLDRTIDSDERYYNSNVRDYDAFKAGAQWKEDQFRNEPFVDYVDRHIVESMVETGKEFVKNNWYNEEEVRDIALKFFYHWYNSPGSNTEQGFDEWFKDNKKKNEE